MSIMSATVMGIKGLTQLSGSFAVAGLVVSQSRTSRTAHAFYVDPALVVFKDVPYPIKKSSGTLVTPGGPKASPDSKYTSFRKLPLCHTFIVDPRRPHGLQWHHARDLINSGCSLGLLKKGGLSHSSWDLGS